MCNNKSKHGFTISIVSATIAVMIILVSTVAVVGVSSINSATFEEYMSALYRVKGAAYDYIMFNKTYPTTGEVVVATGLSDDFIAELVNNGDATADANGKLLTSDKLYVIDTDTLNIVTSYGNGTLENEDVFVVSENMNNVYYLRGKKYKGTTYYGLKD